MDYFTWYPTAPTTAEFGQYVPDNPDNLLTGFEQHPGGGYIFYDESKQVFSLQRLTDEHITAANYVLDSLKGNTENITIVVHLQSLSVYYYVVQHTSRHIEWASGHASPNDAIRPDLEYWTHIQNFPVPRGSFADDLVEFQKVLANNIFHNMYPQGSGRPIQPQDIAGRLNSLKRNADSAQRDPIYATWELASYWVNIIGRGGTRLSQHQSMTSYPKFDFNPVRSLFEAWWQTHPDNRHWSATPLVKEVGQSNDKHEQVQSTQLDHRVSSKETTSIDEILQILKAHKCVDVTADLVRPPSGNSHAEGGFGVVQLGDMRSGNSVIRVCLKSLRSNEKTPEADHEAHEADHEAHKAAREARRAERRKLLKRTVHELYIWAKCEHPNVLKLIGVAQSQKNLFMVSPWMMHGNLGKYLAGKDQETRYKKCVEVSNGVAYLHRKGIVHGDLKCHNIVVDESGTPKITDFGGSALEKYSIYFSPSGPGAHTRRWAAPEILDEQPKTSQADIYSLGMTILEALTGEVPYAKSKNEANVMIRIARGEIPDWPDEWGAEKDKLWELLKRCWAYDPPKRPNATAVCDQINDIPLKGK